MPAPAPTPIGRDHLEHDREGAGVLNGDGVVDDGGAALVRAALDSGAAQRVLRLRGESDVADDRDARLDDRLDRRSLARAAFQLDGVGARLHQADGRAHRLGGGLLVAAEGQVGHDEGARGPSGDGPRGHEDLLEADGGRRGIAQQRVPV